MIIRYDTGQSGRWRIKIPFPSSPRHLPLPPATLLFFPPLFSFLKSQQRPAICSGCSRSPYTDIFIRMNCSSKTRNKKQRKQKERHNIATCQTHTTYEQQKRRVETRTREKLSIPHPASPENAIQNRQGQNEVNIHGSNTKTQQLRHKYKQSENNDQVHYSS